MATNADGAAAGADQSFATLRLPGTNWVTTLADSGAGSLRQALLDAMDGDTIAFAVTGAITLAGGELAVTNSLAISGPGATNLAVSGNNGGRVFNIASNAVVTISDLTIRNGKAANGAAGANGDTGQPGSPGGAGSNGGGIYNAGNLTLIRCVVRNNAAGNGGNGGDGGTGNSVGGNGGNGGRGGSGGGVYNAGTLTLSACTFSDNAAGNGGNGGSGGSGGSVGGAGGNGGRGGSGGGLLSTVGASEALVRNSILASNAAGNGGAGGSGNPGGIAGAPGGDPDISGAFTSLGHNFIRLAGLATGFINGVNGDILGSFDPRLGPLADNGGPTPTIALLPGSPALDAGDDALTGADQRGMPRKVGEHVDIGAYEMNAADALAHGSAPALGAVSCAVSNLPSGVSVAVFTFSVNPNGLDTAAWIEYGVTPGYGAASRALALGYTNVSVATNVTVTGLAPGMTYRYRLRAQNLAGTEAGPEQTFTTTPAGDLDGDGVVSSAEMNAIGLNFWGGTANYITNLTDAGGGRFNFGLGSDVGLSVSVQRSTNLQAGGWTTLTNAAGFYFYDPDATNHLQRYYRLIWP